ncbi:MAG: PHP domain-containing protein [Clostridia bacterium]|nr:PHP domain-containing protein [Clostridia bacterium]
MNQRKLDLYYILMDNINNLYLKKGLKAEADLHVHTTFSDGAFDILDIITLGKMIGLKKIIITDHNTILPAYQYLETMKWFIPEGMSIEVGSEIACKIIDNQTGKYVPIEILAYYADPYMLQSFIDRYSFSKGNSQEEQLKELMDMCKKYGLTFSKDLYVPNGKFATEILCLELIKHEENKEFFMKTHPIVWTSPKLFYKKFCANPNSEFYLDTTSGLPGYVDTINAILEAGGIPILAHAFLYIYETQEEVKVLLDKLVATSNIAGFEAYHSAHTYAQREFIAEYAKEKKKMISGGTDFHMGPQTTLGFGKKDMPLELTLDMFSWLN